MDVFIRLATTDDAELIADLSRDTFRETFAAENSKEDMNKFLNEQFTKGRLMMEVGEPENIFLLAYVDDEVAGYAKLRDGRKPDELQRDQCMEIARLYVLKDQSGKGVGRQLMNNALDIASELKKNVVWLGVWEKNERAIRFYKHFGFEKFGQWEFLLGDDVQNDWLMKKYLESDQD